MSRNLIGTYKLNSPTLLKFCIYYNFFVIHIDFRQVEMQGLTYSMPLLTTVTPIDELEIILYLFGFNNGKY